MRRSTRFSRALAAAGAAVALSAAGACRDVNVVTGTYATLGEAVAAGAVARGSVPRGLPPGTTDMREAYDPASERRWGLFEFPPQQADALRALVGPEVSFAGLRVNPPRRIEWWPPILRGRLDHARLAATGLQAYLAGEGDLVFAINWNQGRAYYWSGEADRRRSTP